MVNEVGKRLLSKSGPSLQLGVRKLTGRCEGCCIYAVAADICSCFLGDGPIESVLYNKSDGSVIVIKLQTRARGGRGGRTRLRLLTHVSFREILPSHPCVCSPACESLRHCWHWHRIASSTVVCLGLTFRRQERTREVWDPLDRVSLENKRRNDFFNQKCRISSSPEAPFRSYFAR